MTFGRIYPTPRAAADPDARLMRKGKGTEVKLTLTGTNRQGPLSDFSLTEASGVAERDAALEMLTQIPGSSRLTVGADMGCASGVFVV